MSSRELLSQRRGGSRRKKPSRGFLFGQISVTASGAIQNFVTELQREERREREGRYGEFGETDKWSR